MLQRNNTMVDGVPKSPSSVDKRKVATGKALPKSRGRAGATPEHGSVKSAPRGSDVMRLVAEVDALWTELETTRAKVRELEARADVDPLLDILNRRGFERELTRSLAYVKRYGTPAALLYLDLDDFKSVNDCHGHAAGDAVLRAVASALVRYVRASDVVARLGGDEFAVLLWNLSESDAAHKALAIEAVTAGATVRLPDHELRAGASVGMAMLGPLDSAAEVLARADQAMYARKASRHRPDA